MLLLSYLGYGITILGLEVLLVLLVCDGLVEGEGSPDIELTSI